MRSKLVISGMVLVAQFFVLCPVSWAENWKPSENFYQSLVNAIGRAENSKKFPYGIKSIPTYGDPVLARKYCLNTVRNQWKRYLKTDSTPTRDEYLVSLANRYCPIGAPDDPTNLNVNWLLNVRYFMGV